MKVVLGCDQGGFALKGAVLRTLDELKVEYRDFGCFSEEPVDYPDIACEVARAVASGDYDRGILMCGTGIGMSIAANKVKGIRAAHCEEVVSARLSRAHNNANVLTMGGRILGPELAAAIVKEWIQTEFDSGGRHSRRVNKIARLESGEV
jgi:ribose 5-phosphate isomerase B